MQQPLQITFRDMEPSSAVETRIRELVKRLERFDQHITSCHVTIRMPHRRHSQGQLFDVRIHINVPGEEIVIGHQDASPEAHAHEDAYVALRDAFSAAGRRLEDYVRKRDHRTRPHEAPTHGTVTRIFPQDGCGFIETSDGLPVYFHQNAVLGAAFAKLKVGDDVRLELSDRESEKGPQATTVRLIGKHQIVD